MPEPPEAADGLYDLPLDRFVTERDALARSLRAGGDRDAAAAVKALRRPSTTAWALNRAVRADPSMPAALRDLAARLRDAQATALRGDAAPLRALAAAERTTVDELARAAVGVAASAGIAAGDAFRRRVTSTIRAGLADDHVLAELVAGRLGADRDAPGFAFSGDIPTVAPATAPDPRAEREARLRRERAEADASHLEARAADLERAAREAAERADRLVADAAAARAAADAARRALAAELPDSEPVGRHDQRRGGTVG